MNHNQAKNKKDISSPLISLFRSCADYSKVMTISSLIEELCCYSQGLNNNILEISKLNQKEKNEFDSFASKGIICFPEIPQFNFKSFISQVQLIENIRINSNITLLNLLAEAISTTMGSDYNNYAQCSGIKLSLINETNNNLLKDYSNRLIHTHMFEILRLYIGDWVLLYIFKYCSVFIYDEQAKNYFQVLGYSLKEIMTKLLGVPLSSQIIKSNYYFQKVYTSSNNALLYNMQNSKHKIPYKPHFIVERTKIYYCPNFNRKLGFFKKLPLFSKDKNGEYTFGIETYNKLFSKCDKIIPLDTKSKIIAFLNQIQNSILQFNFSFELFKCCPIINKWNVIKSDVIAKLKKIQTSNDNQNKTQITNEFNDLMDKLKLLINSYIPYDKIFLFVTRFLSRILPKKFLGKKNFCILLSKVKLFISMNRFETFNKINLFDNREFSFNEMKWLEMKMKSKAYSEYGILLKNFIMKTLIHWIFDFLLVHLFRSHFFITEKQGDHFRTFYYHKIIYDLIIKICFNKYIHLSQQYKVISKNDADIFMKNNDLAFGRLRLMPKPSTMRPITSFKKKTYKTKVYLKNKLFGIQKIFKFIQNKMQKNTKNCVVFDYKEIIKRLMNVKLKMIKTSANFFTNNNMIKRYLSYVTMDIEACYDNIDISLLNQFLDRDDTISPTYVTGILYVLIPKINKVKNKEDFSCPKNELKDCFDIRLLYMVQDLKDYIHVLDFLQRTEDISYSNCILYLDTTTGMKFESKALFIPTVRNIINNNYIKFNRQFLKQIKGIPQGLSVSSFLCNLFFYEIEQDIAYEIQRELINKESLLLRFMDDYLCLSTECDDAVKFKSIAIDLSHQNRFNFNLKKSQSNIKDSNTNNNKVIEDKELKFNWNGIFFQLNESHFFNLIYDMKIESSNFEELNEYTKLINVNLPLLKNIKDFSWLTKKINSVLFSGHAWIYFLSSINEINVLEDNFRKYVHFFLYKLIVLIRKVDRTILQPSQKTLIEVIDNSIKKMFSFFDTKIVEIEGISFFLQYNKFHRIFYVLMFQNYFNGKEYNKKLISYSPLLFKSIKRKIERLKLCENKYIVEEKISKVENELEMLESKLTAVSE